jgi:hypothetical protein
MFDLVRQTTALWDGGSKGEFQDFIEADSHNFVTRFSVHDGTSENIMVKDDVDFAPLTQESYVNRC